MENELSIILKNLKLGFIETEQDKIWMCSYNKNNYSCLLNYKFSEKNKVGFFDIFKSNFLSPKESFLGFVPSPTSSSKIREYQTKEFSEIKQIHFDLYEKYKHLNSTITQTFSLFPKSNKSILSNIPYSLKDLFCTESIKTTGGSSFYKNYIAQYSSTVYKILQEKGGYLVGKDTCDEFGCGGSGMECSAISNLPVVHYLAKNKVVPGSCSGSANKVATGEVLASIGVDTVDSIRLPSSVVGIVGYKPTYGLISRYGCFSFCNSLDTVGIMASNVNDVGIFANELIKYDEKDMTSQILDKDREMKNFLKERKINVGFIQFSEEEWLDKTTNKEFEEAKHIRNEYEKFINENKNEFNFTKIVLPKYFNSNLLFQLYHVLCYSDFFSNRAKDTLINTIESHTFKGDYYEKVTKERSENLSFDVKRKMVLGASFVNHGIDKIAFSIRDELVDYFLNLFSSFDCIIMPGSGDIAPDIDFKNRKYTRNGIDQYLKLGNFCGFCSITIPFKNYQGLPFGLNINCKQFDDLNLLNIALKFEEVLKK